VWRKGCEPRITLSIPEGKPAGKTLASTRVYPALIWTRTRARRSASKVVSILQIQDSFSARKTSTQQNVIAPGVQSRSFASPSTVNRIPHKPATMRAQILESFNTPYKFTADHPSPPQPKGYEALIHVQAASYCHTDAVFVSGAMQQGLPRIGSHEFAGVVEAFGPDAEKFAERRGLKTGDLVGIPGRAFNPCGECRECTENDGDSEGYGVWCTRALNLGLTRDGGFQEWCVVDARQVAKVPSGQKATDIAPLMCAGVTVWNALETAGVNTVEGQGNGEGKSVAILGAGGGLGHLGVQFAAKLGWHVVAVDTTPAMGMLDEVVKSLGDDGKRVHLVDALKESAEDAKKRIFGAPTPGLEGEKGCDSSLILPESQAAFNFGMAILRNHGTCVAVSFPKDGWTFKPGDLVFRHIKLVGVLTGRNRQLQAMVDFAAKAGVKAKVRTYPLEKLNELVGDYHKGVGGKLVVDMQLKP
jgi:D-arabinose 1-dehydrogenase-like Zn-dependent alcohol dehydrogenase